MTRDADLAVELATVRDGELLGNLRALGYDNPKSGNRFERDTAGLPATIDLLVPSYTSGHVTDIDAGPIAVDGFPALHIALSRDPVVLDLHVELESGAELTMQLMLPDLPTAIALKVLAYHGRFAQRDAEDVRRLLEGAHLDGVRWPRGVTFRETGELLTTHFDSPGRGLPKAAQDVQGRTRMRALIRSLLTAADS